MSRGRPQQQQTLSFTSRSAFSALDVDSGEEEEEEEELVVEPEPR